ncbi:MAG: hypothetical protein ABJE66_21010 [Deltaproteobacteria bacterium]
MRCPWLLLAACGSPAAMPDAYTGDSTPVKAVACATSFGAALTNSFGRLDGTLLAVIPPNYQGCAQPNSTHTVVQVMVGGAAYRMVVNVLSTSNQPHVYLGEVDARLAGPAWAEGWHPDAKLDYVTTLGVMKSQFTEADEASAAARIYDMLVPGDPISVFATSSGPPQADSAHLVHRNSTNADGAIVLHPATSPHYLLTAFDEQSF